MYAMRNDEDVVDSEQNPIRDSGHKIESRSVGVVESLWVANSSGSGYR